MSRTVEYKFLGKIWSNWILQMIYGKHPILPDTPGCRFSNNFFTVQINCTKNVVNSKFGQNWVNALPDPTKNLFRAKTCCCCFLFVYLFFWFFVCLFVCFFSVAFCGGLGLGLVLWASSYQLVPTYYIYPKFHRNFTLAPKLWPSLVISSITEYNIS